MKPFSGTLYWEGYFTGPDSRHRCPNRGVWSMKYSIAETYPTSMSFYVGKNYKYGKPGYPTFTREADSGWRLECVSREYLDATGATISIGATIRNLLIARECTWWRLEDFPSGVCSWHLQGTYEDLVVEAVKERLLCQTLISK